MYKQNNKPGDILSQDWMEYIQEKVGQEPWVTVYCSNKGDWGATCFFSAFIPNSKVGEALNNESWDLSIGNGMPCCSESYFGTEDKQINYQRFGNDDGIEPLILCREFHGMKKNYVEVSEEFRLFHNLYYDRSYNNFVKIDDSGVEENIILVQEDQVQIKLKHLKQFLAIKGMHLAIFFSIDRYSDKTLVNLGLKKSQKVVNEGNLRYYFYIHEPVAPIKADKPILSRLEGKKLIPGMPKEKSGFWPFEEEKEEYDDFIIGTDGNGDLQLNTCDYDKLSNYFGKNPEAPHFLTPVFFRRDVLTKYYSKPEMYSIGDGCLNCGGLWALKMDNNHSKFITVFLGDLGRDLPAAERGYWKCYNIPPEGNISEVNWKRSFLGEFTDPQKADLAFKYQFDIFQEKWLKKYGWPLFKPLSKDDEHNFIVLRVPVSNEQSEFDQQSMALTKVLIDSLNEEKIQAQIKGDVPKNSKGINKLSMWFKEKGLIGSEDYIKFLRSLQDLRNGAGHRKGKEYQRGATYFNLSERPLEIVFEDILKQATNFLGYMDQQLLLVETK